MNFFDHKDLGNHLLQLCPKVVKHSVYIYKVYRKYTYIYIYIQCGVGSSVDIATDYGLDGPGSNPVGDEIFRPSRPVLGPTQPSVKRVPGLSRG